VLLLLLGLTACSPRFTAPTDAVPEQDAQPMVAALTLVSLRQAVVNYLDGYAHADQDGGELLKASVAGPALQEWARWIRVQNDNRDGTIEGRTTIRNVQFFGPGNASDQYLMQVDATVRFTATAPGEKPRSFNRVFQGQALVARTPTGGWGVFDIIRDGQQLGLQIHILPGNIVARRGGLTVRAASVFTFGSTWVVNLVVDNQSQDSLAVVPRLTWVKVGSVVAKAQTIDAKLRQPVAAGSRVMTQVSVEPGPTVPPEAVLQIAFVTPQQTLLRGQLRLPIGTAGGPTSPTGAAAAAGGGT
jgi:hypothetical protein